MTSEAKTRGLTILVGLLLLLACVQVVVLPAVATGYAISYPEVSALAVPYLAAVDTGILGLQVASVVVALYYWRTARTGMREESPVLGRVFTWAVVGAGAILTGVFSHAAFVANIGGPAMVVGGLLSLTLIISARSLRAHLFATSSDAHRRVGV